MIEIFASNINNKVSEQKYKDFIHRISNEKRKRITNFHYKEDLLRSLYGDIIIRSQAINKKRIHNSDIIFEYNEYGKPFIMGLSNFEFNISHSGDWVVCAVGEKKIGIDIEKMSNPIIDVAMNFFSNYEFNELMQKRDEEQTDYFFDLWTLKESYIKWRGNGLSIPLDSFEFKKREYYHIFPEISEKVKFNQFILDKVYKVAVCSEDEVTQKIKILNMENL